jgi:hypothetical protein
MKFGGNLNLLNLCTILFCLIFSEKILVVLGYKTINPSQLNMSTYWNCDEQILYIFVYYFFCRENDWSKRFIDSPTKIQTHFYPVN